MLSPATADDAAGIAALIRSVHPEQVSTARGVRHWFTSMPPEGRRRWWKAEADGEVVAWASGLLQVWATAPGHASAGLVVHPDRRREGIGSALWELVLAHLTEIGATHVVLHGDDDDASRGFCERRGLRLASTNRILAVDPRTLAAPGPLETGVEVRPCDAYRDDLERLYLVDFASIHDEPSEYDFSGLTFEQWQAITFGRPDFDPRLGAAVEVDGQLVGVSFLLADRESGRASSVGTSVLREHRGRGLATAMKRHSLAAAAAAGIRLAVTENDETNAAMLAINRKLGYQPLATRLDWTFDLPSFEGQDVAREHG